MTCKVCGADPHRDDCEAVRLALLVLEPHLFTADFSVARGGYVATIAAALAAAKAEGRREGAGELAEAKTHIMAYMVKCDELGEERDTARAEATRAERERCRAIVAGQNAISKIQQASLLADIDDAPTDAGAPERGKP